MNDKMISVSIKDIKTEALLEELERRMSEGALGSMENFDSVVSQKISTEFDGEKRQTMVKRSHAAGDVEDGKILYILEAEDREALFNWLAFQVDITFHQANDSCAIDTEADFEEEIVYSIIDEQFTAYNPHERFDE